MLSAAGEAHKRFRRIATPAFSVQHLKASMPVIFQKGLTVRSLWKQGIEEKKKMDAVAKGERFDVCDWVYRATFDVFGVTGELCFVLFTKLDGLGLL